MAAKSRYLGYVQLSCQQQRYREESVGKQWAVLVYQRAPGRYTFYTSNGLLPVRLVSIANTSAAHWSRRWGEGQLTRRSSAHSIGVALLVSLCLIILLALPSRGNASADLPQPMPVPIPDTVRHTDNFGYALGMDGDWLVVGAPWSKVGDKEQQGVVYLYTRSATDPTSFTLLKSLTGSDSSDHNSFGWAVAIHGDTLAVGAYKALTGRGAVYLFQQNQGGANNWGEVKKLVRADNRNFTDFGRTVALHGDTLAVGAPLGLGDVSLFQRNQGGANNWGQTQILTAAYPVQPTIRVASFGDTLAFDGTTLAVGATRESVTAADLPPGSPAPSANFSGGVYLFRQSNGQWQREAKLFSGDLDPAANWFGLVYGSSLALNGDLLFVGEKSGKTNNTETGRVFVYQRGGGTPSLYGQPGPWGEVAKLSPNDGLAGDAFGQALYAVGDGLLVSAQKQGMGRVYFFRNPAAMSSAGTSAPMAWSQVYSFTTSSGAASTFGLPIVGSGESILFGESSANDRRGGINAYTQSALFAFDPNAAPTPTPSPTPQPTATPPPVTAASCLRSNRLYLPVVANAADLVAAAPLAVSPVASVTTTLAPGCVVSGPSGIMLGAVEGAITQTLTISLTVTTPPTPTLPAVATVRSDYWRLAAESDQLAAIDTPFIIGVPVPAGAEVAHLALLYTYDHTTLLDSDATGLRWGYLPGLYDEASNRFLVRLPFLTDEGTTLVLVNHPDFDTGVNPTEGAATRQASVVEQPAAHAFDGWCMLETFEKVEDCTETHEAIAAQMATEIYTRMTETFFYPKTMRLLDTTGQFIVNEAVTSVARNARYAVHLVSKADERCARAVGFYEILSGFLAICLQPGGQLGEMEKETLIHELFHAFQYTYPLVMTQWEGGRAQQWAIEGMAEASVKSYPETVMRRSPHFGITNLQDVDRPLTVGRAGDGNNEEYLAQDFWVYVGASQNRGLDYLGAVLALGGVNVDDYEFAFQTLFHQSFREIYWSWVKNQTIENRYEVGVGTGQLCKLSADALHTTRPTEFLASKTYFPYDTGAAFDRLPPLTARVVEIKFGAKPLAIVTTGYSRCAGLTGELAVMACKTVERFTLRSKIYVEDEAQCWSELTPGTAADGERLLTNITESKRYFVVVANVDTDEEHAYYLAIE